jgi:hypothetical protein
MMKVMPEAPDGAVVIGEQAMVNRVVVIGEQAMVPIVVPEAPNRVVVIGIRRAAEVAARRVIVVSGPAKEGCLIMQPISGVPIWPNAWGLGRAQILRKSRAGGEGRTESECS